MSKERYSTAITIAKDAIGITAYQWAQSDQAPNLLTVLRKPFGVVCAIREFAALALSRIDRELLRTEDLTYKLTRLSGLVRDEATYLLAFGAFAAVVSTTDIDGAASALSC